MRISLSDSPPSPARPRSTSHLERSTEHGGLSYHGEDYELNPEFEEWSKSAHRHRLRPHYCDGDTIDWWHEDASERERWKRLVSQYGFRGFVLSFVDVTKLWFVIILTGICVGLAGGWLDILVMW
jgi:chloride channel 3/4/5